MTLSDPHSGLIPGATLRDQAIALAGLLAEHGVTSLTWTDHAGSRDLATRQTDLPGLILHAVHRGEIVSLRAQSLDLTVQVAPDALAWMTMSDHTAHLLRA